mgnify:CR=1 FL=1
MKRWSSSGPILGRHLALSLNTAILATEWFLNLSLSCIGPREVFDIIKFALSEIA